MTLPAAYFDGDGDPTRLDQPSDHHDKHASWQTDASGNVMGLVGPDGDIVPQGLSKTGASFILLGDSITAMSNQGITVTALARSGSTVTATATSHGIVSGQRVKICNAMPDDFNGEYSITRVGANSFTYASAGTAGAATLSGHPSTGTFETRVMDWGSPRGWWNLLEASFFGGVKLVKNLAIGGWKATYAAARTDWFDAQLAGAGATDICIAYGINDCISSDTVANITGALADLCDWAKTKGARVWLETVKPVESGYSNSTNINKLVAKVNRSLRDYARDTPGVYLVDTYSAVVNPATGHCTAGLTTDNIHSNEGCARVKLGPTWAAAMSGIVKPSNPLAMGVFDNVGADAASKVLWDYGPWVNTNGGTTAGTVSGDVSANFKIEESGSGSVAASLAARSDGFGYDQIAELTAAANNDYVEITAISPTVARFVGKTVRLLIPFTLTGNTAGNVKGLYAQLRQTVGGVSGYSYSGSNSVTNAQFGTSDDTIIGVLCTQPMLIDAAASAILLGARMTCAGAGTPTLKIGRITVLDVS